jgi:hypothetical protein
VVDFDAAEGDVGRLEGSVPYDRGPGRRRRGDHAQNGATLTLEGVDLDSLKDGWLV